MVGLGPVRVPARAAAVGGDQGVPVLMYHRVDRQLSARDSITVHLTVMQSAFEAQLQALRAAGYRSMSLEMLRAALDRPAVPARRVVLTFDDGYEDHFATVLPLLRKYGFAGTFFIVPLPLAPVTISPWPRFAKWPRPVWKLDRTECIT